VTTRPMNVDPENTFLSLIFIEYGKNTAGRTRRSRSAWR